MSAITVMSAMLGKHLIEPTEEVDRPYRSSRIGGECLGKRVSSLGHLRCG